MNYYKLTKVIIAISIGTLFLWIILLQIKPVLEKEVANIRGSQLLKIPGVKNLIGIKVENGNYKSTPIPISPEQRGFLLRAQADYQEILNSSSAWKTYQNNYFGFLFQYPDAMTLLPEPEPELESQKMLIIDGNPLFQLEIQKVIDGNAQRELHYFNDSYVGLNIKNKDCTEPFLGRTDIPTIYTQFGDGFDINLMYNIFTNKGNVTISWWGGILDPLTWGYQSVKESLARLREPNHKEIEEEIAKRKLRVKILKTITFTDTQNQPIRVTCIKENSTLHQ